MLEPRGQSGAMDLKIAAASVKVQRVARTLGATASHRREIDSKNNPYRRRRKNEIRTVYAFNWSGVS